MWNQIQKFNFKNSVIWFLLLKISRWSVALAHLNQLPDSKDGLNYKRQGWIFGAGSWNVLQFEHFKWKRAERWALTYTKRWKFHMETVPFCLPGFKFIERKQQSVKCLGGKRWSSLNILPSFWSSSHMPWSSTCQVMSFDIFCVFEGRNPALKFSPKPNFFLNAI